MCKIKDGCENYKENHPLLFIAVKCFLGIVALTDETNELLGKKEQQTNKQINIKKSLPAWIIETEREVFFNKDIMKTQICEIY